MRAKCLPEAEHSLRSAFHCFLMTRIEMSLLMRIVSIVAQHFLCQNLKFYQIVMELVAVGRPWNSYL